MGEQERRSAMGLGPRVPKLEVQQIPVDITNAIRKTCECGSEYFIPVLELYIVSALVSPIGKEMLAQKPALVCLKCQKPLNLKSEGDDGGEGKI